MYHSSGFRGQWSFLHGCELQWHPWAQAGSRKRQGQLLAQFWRKPHNTSTTELSQGKQQATAGLHVSHRTHWTFSTRHLSSSVSSEIMPLLPCQLPTNIEFFLSQPELSWGLYPLILLYLLMSHVHFFINCTGAFPWSKWKIKYPFRVFYQIMQQTPI